MIEKLLRVRINVFQNRIASTFFVTILLFPISFNPKILNPFNYGWLWSGGDISASFAGWNYFRHVPFFQWPLSANPLNGGLISQPTIFTDTPPLFALPAKILGLLTSQIFQFTGFQIFLSMFLTIYFSVQIFTSAGVRIQHAYLGAAIISQAPFLMFRNQFEHYSLNLMWIALASLYFYMRDTDETGTSPRDLQWFLLLFISLTWMPYLVIFIICFWIPWFYQKRMRANNRRLFLKQQTLGLITSICMGLTIDGYWQNLGHSNASGIGFYNANLLTFVNPRVGGNQDWSRFLPGHDLATDGQYEGFAFLGTGALLLIVINLTMRLTGSRNFLQKFFKKKRPLVISMAAMMLWATGGMFSIGQQVLLQIRFPAPIEAILGTFRSSGRFILPVGLFLLVLIVLMTYQNFKSKTTAALLLIALILTSFDQAPNTKIIKIHQSVANTLTDEQEFIRETLLTHKISRVVFLTPEISAYDWKMIIIGQCSILGIPVNDGFIARVNQENLKKSIMDAESEFLDGPLQRRTLYVLYPSFIERFKANIIAVEKKYKTYMFKDSQIVIG